MELIEIYIIIISVPIIFHLWKFRYHIFVRKDSRGYKRVIGSGDYAHRKIIEQNRKYKLGKYIVHHKDGNKSNNRRSNLRVMRRSTHSRLHAKGRRKSSIKRKK